jgi:primosomal protein N' (replication factor Y)
MSTEPRIAQVALDTPLRTLFDYLIPEDAQVIKVGQRVKVPFGRRQMLGVVIRLQTTSSVNPTALRSITEIIDRDPLFDQHTIGLIEWAAAYYQYPFGQAIFSSLPPALRKISKQPPKKPTELFWTANEHVSEKLKRARRQAEIYQWLLGFPGGVSQAHLLNQFPRCQVLLKRLQERGLIQADHREIEASSVAFTTTERLPLTQAQQQVCEQISSQLNAYSTHLLEGVTGSGKTEVYFYLIEKVLREADAQILIVVPEIGLTPQLYNRLYKYFTQPIGVLHSNISERQRGETWLKIQSGEVRIVLGTRLAVFTPMPRLKLIVVDEEHDASLKQQEGFLYHARDVAIYRARLLNIPIILGSATPSFESLSNVENNKFQHLQLHSRVHKVQLPAMKLVDMRSEKATTILSNTLRLAMHRHLEQGNQVILFLNRRGYAPALICHACGWAAQCSQCDVNMTLHTQKNKLICHHCDHAKRVPDSCPDCQASSFIPVGHGTQRVEEVLAQEFPDYRQIRLDRDATRKKGYLQEALEGIRDNKYQIILGTQMLSKGHDFSKVSLVGVLDIDYGIYSADFRALEKTAQLLVQVAGRSGRRQQRGEVLVQTHAPDHPMLHTLLSEGYSGFSKAALQMRKQMNLPPYAYHISLRVRAASQQQAFDFLHHAKNHTQQYFSRQIQILGPVSANMEKRAGQYRAFITLVSPKRGALSRNFAAWLNNIEKIKTHRSLHWSIDVDPIDNF